MFFFKQKTAYEMRMCDWSSDVCSAELLVEVLPEMLHRLVERRVHRADARVAVADQRCQLLGRNHHLAHAAAVDDQQARGQRADPGNAGGCFLAVFVDQAQPLPRAQSSEEQTAELKSLMRISYAVSCMIK